MQPQCINPPGKLIVGAKQGHACPSDNITYGDELLHHWHMCAHAFVTPAAAGYDCLRDA